MKLVRGFVLVVVFNLASSELATSQDTAVEAVEISITTPILLLLEHPRAREIVERHLPNLVRALDEDYDIAEYLGTSSLTELSIDDDHVMGFDDELLATLQRELSAAQAD